jgi:hypothetical protein
MRSWKIRRWTQLSIEELATSFNHVLRGSMNYYGRNYRSMLSAHIPAARLRARPLGATEMQAAQR